jgi:hypothetical protein
MNRRMECEFSLLRYVPDPVRNEFVHIGVLLRAGSAGARQVLGVKFTADWRRVRCLDPEADTEMLEALEAELRRRFAEEPEGNLMHVLEDSFSNCVQMSESRAYLAESVEAGMEELMRLYVEPQQRERSSRVSGRAAIQGAMRTEFERVGVWDLLRKRIAAATYTRPGDPLRIDAGYRVDGAGFGVGFGVGRDGEAGSSGQPRPEGLVRMFHAVSLEHLGGTGGGMGVEMAKVLAFSASSLRAGVERVERAALELTAVIEPWSRFAARDDRAGAYRFAVETMEEHGIQVRTTAEMAAMAERARVELRV